MLKQIGIVNNLLTNTTVHNLFMGLSCTHAKCARVSSGPPKLAENWVNGRVGWGWIAEVAGGD